MLFNNLTIRHKVSLYSFVLAKLCGMLGVALGFGGTGLRDIGGFVLAIAFFFIFVSIMSSVSQLTIDKQNFEAQDPIIKRNRELKAELKLLEKQVNELKLESEKLLNLKIRKNIF